MRKPISINTLALALAVQACTANVTPASYSGQVNVNSGPSPKAIGSGRVIEESRSVAKFTTIEASDASDIVVTIGDTYAVSVMADDNLISQIVTTTEDGVLKITSTGSYSTRKSPVVTITMPILSDVILRGSGDARIFGLQGGNLSLHGQGSGDFFASGRVDQVMLSVLGSGNAHLSELFAHDVDVSIFGSGSADVRADGFVRAGVWGSGNVRYSGTDNVMQSVSGTGNIRRKGR